jgi:precorrin-8X/cobalt-precorrin-8 methylmutase
MRYLTDGLEIEKKSFEIIGLELGDRLPDGRERKIITRIIHATADFDYAGITRIHPRAIDAGLAALKSGCAIYVDTRMILAGINTGALRRHGASACCLNDDEGVKREALERGVTRSIVAMEKACAERKAAIFIIGNAPTALFTLVGLVEKKSIAPQLIIGVPVGFVGAAESKEALRKLDIPYILTEGRKGGSTVAVAIANALMYMGTPYKVSP